jgi:uncharacterized protein (TIGR02145 family)
MNPNSTTISRVILVLILSLLLLNNCGKEDSDIASVKDVDGNTYRVCKIGEQHWIAENLKTTRYNDGSPILRLDNDSLWITNTKGAYSIYPHDTIMGFNSEEEVIRSYGLLYNWAAVNNVKGLCPVGWRVPDDYDLLIMELYVAEKSTGFPARALKACQQVDSPLGGDCNTNMHPRWDIAMDTLGIPIVDFFGSDESGFSAKPAGLRNITGQFRNIGRTAHFWSSSETNSVVNDTILGAWSRTLAYNADKIFRNVTYKNQGFSVRCIRVGVRTED